MTSIDVMSDTTGKIIAEKLDTQNILLTAIAGKDGGLPIKDWASVQALVRLGLAPKVFAIGDQLICNHETYGELVWDIIGFDHDVPVDGTKTHSMTIQLHSLLPDSLVYDAIEALYYAKTELPAGTYNFTLLNGYDTAYGGGKTYYFTIANPVPAGGQIVFNWSYQKQAAECKISTYESQTSTTALESVSVTEGSEGTALESIGECNNTHRIRYGSNNWTQSAIKQRLNSDAAAGDVWTPKSNFDRPPSWATTTAGFLNGLDADFLAVIGEVDKITVLNNLTDGGGSKTNVEKFFLLSRSEVYGGDENAISEGDAYPYYSETSDLSAAGAEPDTNRIKYRNGVAQYWWLRSPLYEHGSNTWYVNPSGAMYYNLAISLFGIAPACVIV